MLYNAHQGPAIIQAAVLGTVTTTAVALRFLARAKKRLHYGADDWFALVALVLYWILLGFGIRCS